MEGRHDWWRRGISEGDLDDLLTHGSVAYV